MRSINFLNVLLILFLLLHEAVIEPNGFFTMTGKTVYSNKLEASKEIEQNKNFNLSKEEFDTMVSELRKGDNTLFRQIFTVQAQQSIRHIEIKYKAQHNDAYDAFIEALIYFRQRILEDKIKYGNLKSLLNTIASQQYLKIAKKQFRSIEPDHLTQIESDQEVDLYSEDQIKNLQIAFSTLGDDCRKLLTMNYYGSLKLNEIASEFGKSPAATRKKKERCKQKLIDLYNNLSDE